MSRLAAFLAILAALSAAEAGAQASRYTITDIGADLADGDSYANAINNSGQVVGSYRGALPGLLPVGASAFVYSGGATCDLGGLPGGGGVRTDSNYAYAVNSSGQIVGLAGSSGPTDLTGGSAFVYSGGTMQSLGLLPGYPPGGYSGWPGPSTAATGINDSGQIVGNAFFATGGIAVYPRPPPPHAFLYSGGVMQDLGTLPGGSFSEANGINQNGNIVGGADNSSGYERAFLCSGGTMHDLGTLSGGSNSVAFAINGSGQIVGMADNSSGWGHAFLYSNGTMQDLGTLPGAVKSAALAINQSGQIVGETDSAYSLIRSTTHSFTPAGR
jgi:probable HAF family extracellular repeat protein